MASPSGLNNIPTADIVPEGILVWQAWGTFAEDADDTYVAGLKFGPAKNIELGLDHKLGSGDSGPLAFQGKYRFFTNESGLSATLGLANVNTDRDQGGPNFPYAALTQDFGGVRGHLGYEWQDDNEGLFLGLDHPAQMDLTLRADWTQTDDGEESMSSIGFIYTGSDPFLVEAWASFPTAAGADTSWTLKFDYVIPFR
ncbi:MAG: hypothetical protein JSV79_00680 [Armatimonadota bacterium]|nr:MAG: hypothetical protein JSV79_00680 [Armatimonadota bacterium]